MTATLIGISIGPGASDLLTVRAVDRLGRAPVVAHMHAEGRPGLALDMVREHLPETFIELAVPVPMGADEATRRAAYDAAMPAFREHLDQGRDVAFICEGDALFYGSFQYVMERLADDYAVEVVPGVTSVSAAAAAARLAIARGDDTVHVLPATLSDGALAARLSDARGACAILKLGRHVGRVRDVLARLGRLDGAVVVEKATWADERVVALKDFEGDAPYFAQVLVPPAHGADPAAVAPEGAAIVCLNGAGLAVAKRLKAGLAGAVLYGRKGRVEAQAVDRLFDDTAETLCTLFEAQTPIVALAAAGIVVRTLAPMLADKRAEPPVVALSNDGAHVVPLLGGHGGANRLARAIADITQGHAAITTGGDTALTLAQGTALDEPPREWTVENPGAVKDVAARLLSGGVLKACVESGDTQWLGAFEAVDEAAADVLVTHRTIMDGARPVLHPPTLALGVGCERGCAPEELKHLVLETLDAHGLSRQSIACVASIDVKADEAAVLDLATALGVPARFFTADALNEEAVRLKNPSDTVAREVGCPGVAEGAALAAGGPKATLAVEKTKSTRATCAVALSPGDIDAGQVGRGRGRLFIVGIGPGTPDWRTPAVTRILTEVSDVVGYGMYLDLVDDLIRGKARHVSNLAEEEARVRRSLELAAEGRDVALVSSGDVGIYAMAALAFELLEREDDPDWNRLAIHVEPGISAFQAAAARIGAPVGHDFCLISLSDLLTPWDVIERRLNAAAQGGFVVAFYNPVSKRRQTQLARARDILLTERDAETPVVLARQLGRSEEDVRVTTLGALTPEDADMLTLVMVGGDNTRAVKRGLNTWVYTPRGYGVKMDGNFTPKGDPS